MLRGCLGYHFRHQLGPVTPFPKGGSVELWIGTAEHRGQQDDNAPLTYLALNDQRNFSRLDQNLGLRLDDSEMTNDEIPNDE